MSTSNNIADTIQNTINGKIKPLGSLGKIEQLAAQIATLQLTPSSENSLSILNPTLLVFAGDHGIAKHNISIAPRDVTTLMVSCFLSGQAAINSFIKSTNWQLKVVDCGIQTQLPTHNKLINARLGNVCGDISVEPALTETQFDEARLHSEKLLQQLDTNLIAFGEMGIGNTSPASAIFAKLFKLPVENVVGHGTGIDQQQFNNKHLLISKAVNRVDSDQPLEILRQLGSFEIATMTFTMLEASKHNKLILVDGFIVTSAAAIALAIKPSIRTNLVFAHKSNESAHGQMLEKLAVEPLLDLSLRLGEGTGAALCLGLIEAAVNFYNEMASFEDLGISL
ncbi:nicotinate-nucleotide--dimethylbenzimidazole phosphoribosyltransferase [Pseudoalteromonas spongiae]|uniref:Nicotinate-nucleotide--dimethylbenzimidazole phosphoribosyltransferase n=1 Tax=Pseudoalteromonas spongiae TaxID=298657 RepID=A0ABU8ESX6_9GAMM